MVGRLNKILAGVVVLCTFCTSAAFAKDPVAVSKEDDVVTVSVSTLGAGEETTLLVVPQGTSVSDAFADTTKIYHMDQAAASATGVAAFKFKYTGAGSLDIYSGYATMSAEDVPYEGVLDLSGGTGAEPGGKFTYGDVNNDGTVDTSDAVMVVYHFLSGTPFYEDITTQKVYEYGELAADVDGVAGIDTQDAVLIVYHFLSGTQFPVTQQ